jgi:hypothetical protein
MQMGCLSYCLPRFYELSVKYIPDGILKRMTDMPADNPATHQFGVVDENHELTALDNIIVLELRNQTSALKCLNSFGDMGSFAIS